MRRRHRFSAPSIEPPAASGPNDARLARHRRFSTGGAALLAHTDHHDQFIPDAEDPEYLFPTWWFFVIPSQFYLVWIFETCLWGIVYPNTLAKMYENPAFVLAITGTIGTIMGFLGPFTGSLSDRLPEMFPAFSARWGRRRPLYWLGQVVGMIGVVFTRQACLQGVAERSAGAAHVSASTTAMLLVSCTVSNFCWQFTSPTYGSIVPETVPESQRGQCVAIQAWIQQVCLIAGNGCGILVGEGHLSDKLMWDCVVVCGFIQIPLACWAFCGKACPPYKACLYPFVWSDDAKERMPSMQQRARRAKAKMDAVASGGTCSNEVSEFLSPFRSTPAFFWFWVQGFVATAGGIVQGCFAFYWFKYCFPAGYYFGSWKVASSVQSAVGLNGVVGSVANACVAWSGDYWRERVGGRQIVLGFGPWGLTGIIGLLCPFSYVLFSQPTSWSHPRMLFTVVLMWTVYGNVFGGIASAGSGSLGPDVLPLGGDGRPSNAARDSQLLGWAGRVPNVFLPMALGSGMSWFSSELAAFNAFYVVGGVISIASWWILALLVHPPNERPGLHWQCTRHWCFAGSDPWYAPGGVFAGKPDPHGGGNRSRRGGAGARLCDELCFGEGIWDRASSLGSARDPSVAGQPTTTASANVRSDHLLSTQQQHAALG